MHVLRACDASHCCAYTCTTTGPVRGIDFHSNQPLFVSGGDDYKIKVNSGFKLVYTLQYTYSVAQVQMCCRKSGDPLMFCLLTPLLKLLSSKPYSNIHVLIVGMEIWHVLPTVPVSLNSVLCPYHPRCGTTSRSGVSSPCSATWITSEPHSSTRCVNVPIPSHYACTQNSMGTSSTVTSYP